MMIEPPPQPKIEIHEIEAVDLRSVFRREDRTFTPWLSQPENLARLARSLGIAIELEAIEANSGTFRTDILARNLADGTTVVIENQFGRSDHDHFGKIMTYLAAQDAKTVVWIAEGFADEHRAALTWLNDNTQVGFYGVEPRLMRIAESPVGLQFQIVIAPNTFVKQQKQEIKIRPEIIRIRERFWHVFNEALQADEALRGCRLRYGGRLGFQWLLPIDNPEWREDEPHVLVFINAREDRQEIGINLYCGRGARAEAEERLQKIDHTHFLFKPNEGGGARITSSANFSNDASINAAVTELLARARTAVEELRRAFAQPAAVVSQR